MKEGTDIAFLFFKENVKSLPLKNGTATVHLLIPAPKLLKDSDGSMEM